MGLSARVRAGIAAEMAAAPHGERTAAAKRLADVYGVSPATIYRAADRRGTKRKRAPARPEYREWTRVAVALAHRAPKPVPLDLAIEAGVDMGMLPPEAADMPVATARRLARTMGLREKRKRTHRMDADWPMQALQIDGSSSEYLVVDRQLDDGDWLLRLHRRPYAAGYKNKPVKADRMRVLIYAAWDMCTGYALSRYVVAKGENAHDAMAFLCWALAEKDDPRIVMHGVPDDLWSDQGPLFKSGAAADLLDRLGINVEFGEAYAKERMGGVERGHRTRWSRFERALFLRGEATIRLSELNDRLAEFEIRENATRTSRTPVNGRDMSRAAAWTALTNARPAGDRLRALPPDPIETMAREAPRTVDVNGIVRWDNVEYECADWHDVRVVARRAMDGSGDLVLEDPDTGERVPAVRLERRRYGEIRAASATELDRLLGEDLEVPGADVYAPGDGARNVVPLASRAAPSAPLDDPLSADAYRDVDEAMAAFYAIYPHALTAANHAAVVARIEEAALSRAAVASLALELLALAREA